jgi:ABC-type branched-subunit amino acid transport system permease subunit
MNAGEFGFVRSFEIIIMVVLGGLGSVSGAALLHPLTSL